MEVVESSAQDQLAQFQAAVSAKHDDFETRKRARLVSDDNDHDNSRKAFYREFKRVVELADVIIQVLDARDPLSCRCPDVERYIRTTNPNKKIILLLNKIDLVPREVGEQWLKYLREELPTVAFKCSTQQQDRGLSQRHMPQINKRGSNGKLKQPQLAGAAAHDNNKGAGTKQGGDGGGGGGGSDSLLNSSSCLGADTLITLLKNYTRHGAETGGPGLKAGITVGVIGLPNVGKSSLINSLKRAKVAQVGNTPGVTKSVQEVVLDKHIRLLDSPGVVFASSSSTDGSDAAAIALRNSVKVERLSDPITPVGEILKRVPVEKLAALYKLTSLSPADVEAGPERFLQLVALARGRLRRGGTPDSFSAARLVLQDWNDGRIPYYTLPPVRENAAAFAGETAVVSNWAKEFDVDKVFEQERSTVIAHLPSMAAGLGAAAAGGVGVRDFIACKTAGAVRVDLTADQGVTAMDVIVDTAAAAGGVVKPVDDGYQDHDDDDEEELDDDEVAMLNAAIAAARRQVKKGPADVEAEAAEADTKPAAAAGPAAKAKAKAAASYGSGRPRGGDSVDARNGGKMSWRDLARKAEGADLYAEKGQFNPHAARSQKKKARKSK